MAVATEVSGSVPPQNDEAEVAVLGTVLMTEQALDQILIDLHLEAEDFYRPRHQLIFRSMVRLKQKAEPEAIDAITVCDDLKRENELEEAGGQSYVHALPTLVPSVHAVRDYAKIVREHSILRKLLAAAREIQERVTTEGGDPLALVEQAEQAIFRAGHNEDSSRLRSIEDVLHDELDKLERLSKEGTSLTGTPSGFKDLDDITGGFQPGNLIVLAAQAGDGEILPGHQHGRERLRRPRQGRGAVLARDVGGGAGAAVHRLAGEDQRRLAAQGAGQVRAVAQGARSHREAHPGATVRRRLERPRRARAAGQGAPAAQPAPAGASDSSTTSSSCGPRTLATGASSRWARSAAGSRSSRASCTSP